MEKGEAYYSTLSIHCQQEEGAEEYSTDEQPYYYRPLYRTVEPSG